MLFFGVGSGRCGTMTVANLLNAEPGVACLHEGKFRHGEDAGAQWLPFLTLQNLSAYHAPATAETLFRTARAAMPDLLQQHNLRALGDIAYNYAPFVGVIPRVVPGAKLVVIVRDGRDFVRSAYTAENPDPTPVGWLDDRPLSKVERYIALGRLRPAASDPLHARWPMMSPVEKNAWLWAETNRLILDGLNAWPAQDVLMVRFEEFFADALAGYARLRAFLGFEGPPPEAALRLLAEPINARRGAILDKWTKWDASTMDAFMRHAGAMMQRLGYA